MLKLVPSLFFDHLIETHFGTFLKFFFNNMEYKAFAPEEEMLLFPKCFQNLVKNRKRRYDLNIAYEVIV